MTAGLHLVDIALESFMVATRAATKLMTAEELEAMGSADELLELIEGEILEVAAAGGKHGAIESRLHHHISVCVYRDSLGELFGSDTGFMIGRNPDSVLMPDIAFVAAERIPDEGVWDGFVPLAPDLAVEIASPSNRKGELLRKIGLFLGSGTRLAWLVRPKERTITVFKPDAPEQVLGARDAMDGGDVLPGFSLQLVEL